MAAACQSPQLIAIYDVLDGTFLGDPADACRETPLWLIRVVHAGVAIEVSTCDACTNLMRNTPSFRRARSSASARANV